MTHAYFDDYLRGVMRNVGAMTHFCINDYGLSADEMSAVFMNSDVAAQISRGNPRYLAGMSGKELADLLIETELPEKVGLANNELYDITPEYWAGWAMAYYQWQSGKTFAQMYADGLTFDRVLCMYHPLHEADLTKVVEAMDESVQTTANEQ